VTAALSRRLLLRVALVAGLLCGWLIAPASSYARPPDNLSPPSVSGKAQVGQTLTAGHGSRQNIPTGYSYQWMRCSALGLSCSSIPQATGQTYVPVAADVGHRLKVAETASNFNGPGDHAESSSTSAVLPAIPELLTLPSITGMVRLGQVLTVVPGTWTSEPTSFSYQWLLCNSAGGSCAAISGATAQTYVPPVADVGRTLRVTETASNAGGSGRPAESAATAVQAVPVASTTTKGLSPSLPADLQPVLPTRLVLSPKSVTIKKHGIAPVQVRCPASASTGCKGTLTISLLEAAPEGTRVVAARCARGCRPLGGAKYEARAGQRLTLRVHIASYGHGLFEHHRALRVTLTAVTVSDGHTATAVSTISLKAPRGQ